MKQLKPGFIGWVRIPTVCNVTNANRFIKSSRSKRYGTGVLLENGKRGMFVLCRQQVKGWSVFAQKSERQPRLFF